MPIPKTRSELRESVVSSFGKLQVELDEAGPAAGSLSCIDDWCIKDLLAVRAWWTERVIDWVEAGQRGATPVTPAEGYAWSETPRLNADIVRRAQRESYRSIRLRLHRGYERVLRTIDGLDDRELLEAGVFPWAGKYPIVRWISLNTTRQYTTARTFVRRTLREAG